VRRAGGYSARGAPAGAKGGGAVLLRFATDTPCAADRSRRRVGRANRGAVVRNATCAARAGSPPPARGAVAARRWQRGRRRRVPSWLAPRHSLQLTPPCQQLASGERPAACGARAPKPALRRRQRRRRKRWTDAACYTTPAPEVQLLKAVGSRARARARHARTRVAAHPRAPPRAAAHRRGASASPPLSSPSPAKRGRPQTHKTRRRRHAHAHARAAGGGAGRGAGAGGRPPRAGPNLAPAGAGRARARVRLVYSFPA